MTNKPCFLLAGIMIFIGLSGISCSANITSDVSDTFTPLPAIGISATSSITPSPAFLPLLAPTYSTAISYPTAKAVQANAVAFIATDLENNSSLWIANVDGSGERKLIDIEDNESQSSNYLLQWSPDGQWISYISGEDLWIISPGDLAKRKILSVSDNNGFIRSFRWSPDSSQIAYLQAGSGDSPPTSQVGLLDIKTGKTSKLLSYNSSPSFVILISSLSWSPDGRYLLFNKTHSFDVFDVNNQEVSKEIILDSECSVLHYGPVWSPNGQWLYHPVYGTGGEYSMWMCISGLDGSSKFIYINESSQLPAWDTTGNFLYFTVRRINPESSDIDQRLLRYDIRTQETESILSLGKSTLPYIWSLSISPDGHTLELDAQISKDKQSLILLDTDSLTTTRFDIAEVFYAGFFPRDTIWAADNQNLIFWSGTYNHLIFYRLNTQTGKATAISGEHSVEYWVISPVTTSP